MASLIGRIAVGQIVPGSAGAQHPKNPVEHGAGIWPWSPSLPNWFRVKERLQHRALGVGEAHVAISTQARSSTISIWPSRDLCDNFSLRFSTADPGRASFAGPAR